MIALEIFCAFVTIATAGIGAALLALPARKTGSVEIASLSILFGGAFISMTLFLFAFILGGSDLKMAVSVCCLALGISGVLRANRHQIFTWPKLSKPYGCLVAGLLTVFLLLVAWQTINQPLIWDGVLSWEIKARLAFLCGGQIPRSYYTDLSRQWTHPHYPLGIPFTEYWLYLWIGRADQGFVKLLFSFLPAAGAGFLYVGVSKIGGERWRGTVAALLMFFVPSVIIGPGTAAAGWADVPLAIVYVAAVGYLLRYALRGSRGSLHLFGLCAAILPWVKQEGMILWMCLAAIVLALALWRRDWFPVLRALAPGVAVIVGWKLFLSLAHTPPQSDFLPLRPVEFFAHIGRIEMIAKFLGAQFIDWNRWSVLWIATPVALWQLARSRRNIEALVLTLCIFLPVALYSGIYIFSAWPSVSAHISTSLPRLMLDVALVAVLAIALILPSFSSRKNLETV